MQTVKKSDSITDARQTLTKAIGAVLTATGKVLKTKKTEPVKFAIIAEDSKQNVLIFAETALTQEQARAQKLRKGSKVSISGKLVSFGFGGINLTAATTLKI